MDPIIIIKSSRAVKIPLKIWSENLAKINWSLSNGEVIVPLNYNY